MAMFIVFALAPAMVESTVAAEEFYKGKTIRFVVGFSPGGGFDTYARAIGRHISKHIPGHPSIVIQNMTGAGSLVSANYMYNKAKRDGTVIGSWIGPIVLQHVVGNKAVQLDGRKVNWLGAPTSDANVCALTKASGIKTPEDWFASKRPIKIGATGPGSGTDDVPKLMTAAIGLPMKLIEGYRGTAKMRLAAESGEVAGGCWAWQSVKVTWRKAIESGEVRVVIQEGLKSHPDLKNIPLAGQYAKTKEARKLLEIVDSVYSATSRPYSLPPGVPKDRVRLLQNAMMETMRDPALLAEAKRSQLEFVPIDGPTIAKKMAALYKFDQSTISRLREIIVPKR